MPSTNKITNGAKGESEGSGFFGKVKRKLTKSKQKQSDPEIHNMPSQNKCYRDSRHGDGVARDRLSLNGFRNPNDTVSSLRSDNTLGRNHYDELSELENGGIADKYQEQGARPKSKDKNTFVPLSLDGCVDLTEREVRQGESFDLTATVGNTGNYLLTQGLPDPVEPLNSETERLDFDNKESLEPIVVQMSSGLPNRMNGSQEICDVVPKDVKLQPFNGKVIPENGQITHVNMCNSEDDDDDVFIDEEKDGQDKHSTVLQDIGNKTQRSQSEDNSQSSITSNSNGNTIDKDSVQVPPRPKRPPRPLSLNFDLRIPPPIPPRSPLSRSFSLTEASSSPTRFAPSNTSILENGSPTHILMFSPDNLKGSSKSLPQSPTSPSPLSPLDKNRKQKSTTRFSWFHKGKNHKDRNTVHVSMMMNRSLPDIPDEEIQQQQSKTRSKSYHQLNCDRHKRALPIRPGDNNGEVDPGPRSPTSPTEGDLDASKFTSSLRKLSECGWYWGPMNWDDAEAKLADTPDGAFLVRDSSNERYILSLSFRSQGTTHHTRIEHSQGMFGFWSQPQSHGSASIVEFIEKAMQHSKNGKFLYFLRPRFPGAPPVPVQLTKPISRFKRVQTLQHMCRFLIRRLVRIDHIQTLPLPRRVKEYLLEGQYYTREDVEPIEEQENEEEV